MPLGGSTEPRPSDGPALSTTAVRPTASREGSGHATYQKSRDGRAPAPRSRPGRRAARRAVRLPRGGGGRGHDRHGGNSVALLQHLFPGLTAWAGFSFTRCRARGPLVAALCVRGLSLHGGPTPHRLPPPWACPRRGHGSHTPNICTPHDKSGPPAGGPLQSTPADLPGLGISGKTNKPPGWY